MLEIEPVGAIDMIAIFLMPFSRIKFCVSWLKASSMNGQRIYSSSEKNEIEILKKTYESIGYKCLKISALDIGSVDKVSKLMNKKVNMIIGHSGVGKSTLINSISPNLSIKTSEISNLYKQGQHTTTYSEMFDLNNYQ